MHLRENAHKLQTGAYSRRGGAAHGVHCVTESPSSSQQTGVPPEPVRNVNHHSETSQRNLSKSFEQVFLNEVAKQVASSAIQQHVCPS